MRKLSIKDAIDIAEDPSSPYEVRRVLSKVLGAAMSYATTREDQNRHRGLDGMTGMEWLQAYVNDTPFGAGPWQSKGDVPDEIQEALNDILGHEGIREVALGEFSNKIMEGMYDERLAAVREYAATHEREAREADRARQTEGRPWKLS